MFGPSPLLTVTIEPGTDRPDVHLHPGGQGFWVARMVANLGVNVSLCCALGGEPGRVLRALIESERLTLRAVDAGTPNGVYVHDRRSGERVEVVSVESRPLERHAVDALYGLALSAGLDADITLITGCQPDNVINPDVYRRLCADLRANGKTAIADLTGAPLRAVLKGGVELLRLSAEELVSEHYATSTDPADLVTAARKLQLAGAEHVLISRGPAPALLIDDGDSSAQIELVRAGVRGPGSARDRGLHVRRHGCWSGPRDEHDRRAAPWHGRRRAQCNATRSWYRHPRRDRAPRRSRDGRVRRCSGRLRRRSTLMLGVPR